MNPPEPPGGLCQPPAVRPMPGGISLHQLGLTDIEMFDLVAWLKVYHPRTFECALQEISDFRQRCIALERAS